MYGTMYLMTLIWNGRCFFSLQSSSFNFWENLQYVLFYEMEVLYIGQEGSMYMAGLVLSNQHSHD
jgi:hypothetical protein